MSYTNHTTCIMFFKYGIGVPVNTKLIYGSINHFGLRCPESTEKIDVECGTLTETLCKPRQSDKVVDREGVLTFETLFYDRKNL